MPFFTFLKRIRKSLITLTGWQKAPVAFHTSFIYILDVPEAEKFLRVKRGSFFSVLCHIYIGKREKLLECTNHPTRTLDETGELNAALSIPHKADISKQWLLKLSQFILLSVLEAYNITGKYTFDGAYAIFSV